MQRIVIKNFGAVKEADIELKKITVLIGEQASGKSTIAKLVYFFKTLKENFLREIYDKAVVVDDGFVDFVRICEEEFYSLFGTPINLTNFEICYFFTDEKYIILNFKDFKRLNVFFSNEMKMNEITEYSNELIEQQQVADKTKIKSHQQKTLNYQKTEASIRYLSKLLNEVFENKQQDFLYVIAGRNATVSYSELFEKYLFAEVQNKVLENTKLPFLKKRYNIDEVLMLEFIERITELKDFFEEYRNFDNLINYFPKMESQLKLILNKIDKIIKGKYSISENGEKIIYNDKENDYVLLSNASSGQQEVIRILQDTLISVITESIVFRILEEPEAHLFPSAQKELIELLSFLVNQNEDNQILITTHSPYVLTVFNNLIFSKRITDKNPDAINDVNEVIQKEFWIDSDDFSAYNLGKTDDNERHAQSIINEKTGLIEQNYLDEVSEKLGNDFQKLYSIHQKSFSRK